MNRSYVVLGEAPESDSEEEIDSSQRIRNSEKQCKGKVTGGEAPESDEESNADTGSLESIISTVSTSSLSSSTGEKRNSTKNSSLLVKKLRERNKSLHNNVKEFVTQTVMSAGTELNATNQQLLKCQVQLQEAADILKSLKSSFIHLDNNLQTLLSTSFVPYITVNVKNKGTSPEATT